MFMLIDLPTKKQLEEYDGRVARKKQPWVGVVYGAERYVE